VGLYGENLRRQRLSFISVTNTPFYGWTIVQTKDHAHGMFFLTFLAENINIIARHLTTSTTEFFQCKEVMSPSVQFYFDGYEAKERTIVVPDEHRDFSV
jgi:hypothetical protein